MATKTLFYTKGIVKQLEKQTSMGNKIRVTRLLKYMSNNIGLQNKLWDIFFFKDKKYYVLLAAVKETYPPHRKKRLKSKMENVHTTPHFWKQQK